MPEVKKIDVADRAKMIAERIAKNNMEKAMPLNNTIKADLNKRSEIQSREKGYIPTESNANYGIRLSGSKEKNNIITDYSSPRINAADFARELRLRKEKEYAQKRYQQ